MKSTILITVTIITAGIFLQSCKNNNSNSVATEADTSMANMDHTDNMEMKNLSNEMPKSMITMMANMNVIKMTGNFDIDFATIMIPHHQSAIDMAQDYLPNGKDNKIQAIAQNIIDTQKKEIEELKTIVANYKPAETEEPLNASHRTGDHTELMATMNEMMDKMKAMKMSGNADKDFVIIMIPHHESAVTMAEDQISHGTSLELKKLANKIIDDQNKEIKEFNAWLAGM